MPTQEQRIASDHLHLIKSHLKMLNGILASSKFIYSPDGVAAVRSGSLHVRMVIEELMLFCVSAHKTAGEEISRILQHEYLASKKMQRLEKINPKFFPDAIDIVPTNLPDMDGQFVSVEEEYLKPEHAKEYYVWCGNILHASYKHMSIADFENSLKKLSIFINLAERLLRTFEIDISGKGLVFIGHLNLYKNEPAVLYYAGTTK